MKISIFKVAACLVIVGATAVCGRPEDASAVQYSLERYRLIVDRSPFGSNLPDVEASVSSEEERKMAEELEKRYRLAYILEGEFGEPRVGFQNLSPKPGESASSVIMVGESFMGMKLKTVDINNAAAVLERSDGRQITFRLAKQQIAPPPVAAPQRPSRPSGSEYRRPSRPATPPPAPQPQLSAEEQEERRAEIRRNLQEYQMEVIRKGMPPLPVPLTPEMDDQLVSEGHLPPNE